ncbi:CAP domain-containing protein [Paenirhodobacter enshiensis]|uniref:CAP domain-containing protein n=1 Tax=Paenirhodobacter enshiensis TaxID=1105367 RepID=UPI0035B259B4
MYSVKALVVLAAVGLAACSSSSESKLGPDGQPLPQLYKIDSKVAKEIPDRVLTNINDVRVKRGETPVVMDPSLVVAANKHSKDMAAQNRPWHWGTDGSSPLDRGRQAGYPGEIIGEDISESYENEVQTLSAWMGTHDTRDVIINPKATSVGIGWYQEPEGKIWWTLVTGNSNSSPR